jgi:Cu+-exporting ATPase
LTKQELLPITKSQHSFEGKEISEFDLKNIKSLLKNSNHPLSKSLYEFLETEDEYFTIENFTETAGKAMKLNKRQIIQNWFCKFYISTIKIIRNRCLHQKEDEFLGKFIFKNEYREGLQNGKKP